MKIEVDNLMAHATVSALRAGRLVGVNDMGLLEDWEELVEGSDKTQKEKGKCN